MAQSIKNISIGSKIKDSNGNSFIVIARNHYSSNEVTLMSENVVGQMKMSQYSNPQIDYSTTDVAHYLNNEYLNSLDTNLSKAIKVTKVSYKDAISSTQSISKTVDAKVFIFSSTEVGLKNSTGESSIDYVVNNRQTIYKEECWTRTEYIINSNSWFDLVFDRYIYTCFYLIDSKAKFFFYFLIC